MTSAPVLITGAAGFIGARLVEAMNQRGVPVVSVDVAGHFGSHPEHAAFDFGTVVDRDKLSEWLAAESPKLEAVFHMGACADTTVMDDELFERLNVEYSKHLWNWCTQRGVPLLYASSAATYGDGAQGYDDDEERLGTLLPLNPYGRSKHAFDLWALEQEHLGMAPPVWSGWKFFNVYGFGERHKSNMASVVLKGFDQIRERGVVRLFRSHHPDYRDGEQARDFIAVEDVVRVLLFAWEKPIPRGLFNLGTGQARTFLDLVHATFGALGVEPAVEFIDTPEEIRDKYQYFTRAAMDKLRAAGYQEPFLSLEAGVKLYVERLLAAEG